MSEASKAKQVFVSHASSDRELAQTLISRLSMELGPGRVVFGSDFQVRSGDSWPEELRKAINTSDVFLVVLAKPSERANQLMELGAAWIMGKPIIPAVPKDRHDAAFSFSFDRPVIEFDPQNLDHHDPLVEAVRKVAA